MKFQGNNKLKVKLPDYIAKCLPQLAKPVYKTNINKGNFF